ncbi:hypothetical protein LSAT2_001549, partial [Lamellibrachia satsuma]
MPNGTDGQRRRFALREFLPLTSIDARKGLETLRRDEISFQTAFRLTDNKLTGPLARRGEGGTGGHRRGQAGTGGDRRRQAGTG